MSVTGHSRRSGHGHQCPLGGELRTCATPLIALRLARRGHRRRGGGRCFDQTCGRLMSSDVRLLGYRGLAPQIVRGPKSANSGHGKALTRHPRTMAALFFSIRASSWRPRICLWLCGVFECLSCSAVNTRSSWGSGCDLGFETSLKFTNWDAPRPSAVNFMLLVYSRL